VRRANPERIAVGLQRSIDDNERGAAKELLPFVE
jgi:hypothetical protein